MLGELPDYELLRDADNENKPDPKVSPASSTATSSPSSSCDNLDHPNARRVWAKLPPEIHEYFFRHVLAGEHRAKQDLTTQFYQALYDECRRRKFRPLGTPKTPRSFKA